MQGKLLLQSMDINITLLNISRTPKQNQYTFPIQCFFRVLKSHLRLPIYLYNKFQWNSKFDVISSVHIISTMK